MLLEDSATKPPFDAPTLFGPAEQLLIPHIQGYDAVRVVEFALSRSQAILLDPEGREELVERLRAAVPSEPFAINWFCEAWRASAV
jgi:hypothetical protein